VYVEIIKRGGRGGSGEFEKGSRSGGYLSQGRSEKNHWNSGTLGSDKRLGRKNSAGKDLVRGT